MISSEMAIRDQVVVIEEVRMSRLEQVYMVIVVVLSWIEMIAEERKRDDMVCSGMGGGPEVDTQPNLA